MKKKHHFLKLKLLCCVWLLSITSAYAISSPQLVNVRFKNVTLHDVIWELEKQTTFDFVYNTAEVKAVKVSLLVADEIEALEVLKRACSSSGLTFDVHDGIVIIKPSPVIETLPVQTAQQGITIKGRVVDVAGMPIIGMSIVVDGTRLGTSSDIDGEYTISAPANGKLLFSSIGYLNLTVDIGGRTVINVTIEEDAQTLDEVMVVAYGEQRKSAFTGSATVVSAELIALRPVTSVMSALEGITPGLQMQVSSGAPDATPSFRIRGVSSLSAGRDPLIIVDGAPYEGGWNNINPNDIESVTVLKDAASIAIYGARGGNGVILLTTKRPKKMENISVALNTKFAISRIRQGELYDVIRDPGEYYERYYDAMYNYYTNVAGYDTYRANLEANASWTRNSDQGGLGYLSYTVPQGQLLIGQNGKLNPNATLGRFVIGADGKTYWQIPDDWEKETYGTGFRQDYDLSVRGGANKLSVLASVGYTKETGVTDKADYTRFTGRVKTTFDAKQWLKFNFGFDIAVSTTNNDMDYADNSNNIFSNAGRVAPIYPIYVRGEDKNFAYDQNGKMYDYGDGTYNNGIPRPINSGSNRLQEALIQTRSNESVRSGAQAGMDVKLFPELTATVNMNYDERDRRNKTTGQPFYGTSNPGGYVSISHYKIETLNLQQLLNYSKSFGSHHVKATLLHEWYARKSYNLSGRKTTMFSYFENQEFGGAITMTDLDSYIHPAQSEGFGARGSYDYNGIYHIDASYRRDASTTFHRDNRWGNFFSVGAGYIVSRERFFQVSWIDRLKLKVSMGQNGNDQIGTSYFRYEDAYEVQNMDGQIALTFYARGNPNITWETRTAINTGLEFSLLNGRLSGGADYYYNKTTNMLSSISVPYSQGYSSYWANVGSMRNSGVEFELQGDIIRKKDFRWSMYFNASMNRSKILELTEERKGETLYDFEGNEVAKGYVSSTNYFIGEGLEYRVWRFRKYAGVNDDGLAMWYIRDNNTGELSTTTTWSNATYFASESSQPKVLGGFGGSFEWKSLQLSFSFAYRLGGYGWDYGYSYLMTAPYSGRTGYNFHKDSKNSWSPGNKINDFPRWQYDDRYFASHSDRWIIKSDFLSLQNVSLGYTLSSSRIQKFGVEGLTLSLGVDNLFILTHRKGYIPDRSFDGSQDYGYYPNMTKYMLNLSFRF